MWRGGPADLRLKFLRNGGSLAGTAASESLHKGPKEAAPLRGPLTIERCKRKVLHCWFLSLEAPGRLSIDLEIRFLRKDCQLEFLKKDNKLDLGM